MKEKKIKKPVFSTRDLVVTVGDCKVSSNPASVIVTYSLGSCIGLVAYDRNIGVGGILHFMLPGPGADRAPMVSPYKYADTGIYLFLKKCFKLGARRNSLILKAAGGGNMMDSNGHFDIGKKNYNAMLVELGKYRLAISNTSIGGAENRTLRLEIATGQLIVKMPNNKRFEL